LAQYPARFAAAVPICGGGYQSSAVSFKNTPIWVFHGAKDSTEKIAKPERIVEAQRKSGG
jgi:predicted peptidase